MVMVKGYDKIDLNYGMLLDLRFKEGVGTITRDLSNVHHEDITLAGTIPAWTQTPLANVTVLDFNGAGDYMELAAAACADLDFTTEDYSIAGWINYQAMAQSQLLIGRYGVDLDGWEVYLYSVNNTLSLRHHHASLAPTRTGCYSSGWNTGSWYQFVITRSGFYPKHYQNGSELTVSYDAGGLQDPDACNRDLVIGTRYTKNANWYKSYMWGLRIWDRELTSLEAEELFQIERHLFGA
jgi:hypothetical protein